MSQQIVTHVVVRWVVSALLALSPLVSHALGLGKLELKSALNQPLDAEIEFSSISDAERKALKVSLASRADFEAAGAERLPLLSQIKFNVAQRPDGRYILQLKTDAPVDEPFLFIVLQIDWAGGRLVREYTALLDPPSYVVGKPAAVDSPQTAPAVIAPRTQLPSTVETVPPPTPARPEGETRLATPAPPAAEPLAARPPQQEVIPRAGETQEVQIPAPSETARPVIASPENDWSNAVEYTVRPGDTLWTIAERLRTDKQLSMEQVILAIFRNNPDAFFRDNVNNVYAGKILKIPERDAVEATPTSEARREFRVQYSAWKEYRTQLAARGRALKVDPSPAEPTAATAAGTKPSNTPDEKQAASAAAPSKQSEELLKIVRSAGEDSKQKAGEKSAETESTKAVESRERTALAERVATLDESLESKRLENRELTEKVGQVRSQIKNEKRLIELESQTLAQQTAKPAEPPKPEMPKPEIKPEPAPTPAPEAKTAVPPPAKPVTPAPKPRAQPTPPPPLPEKGLLDNVIDTVTDASVFPLVGGVLVLLGGGVLMVYMRRRRRSIAEFEESILASDAIATEASPTSSETTGHATSGDTSFLSDFSKGGMGQVHTDEVDPVAEAEVYLAYGRDETAEEILKEAIVKNPERHELKQKLLEILHQRNDVNGFETLAEELYAALGGRGGKIWEKVEELGRKLNPENPMFRGGAPDRRGDEPASMAARPAHEPMAGKTMPAAMAHGAAAATQVADQTGSVEFDFDSGSQSVSADASVEFSLDTEDSSPSATPANKPVERRANAVKDLDEFTLDSPTDNVIDFEGGKGGNASSSAFDADTTHAGGDDEIKWDLDTQEAPAAASATDVASEKAASGNGADEQWDETATKLDLAKAYIDMGDAEGARSILDEVLAEGNDQQKKQAAELAAQIA